MPDGDASRFVLSIIHRSQKFYVGDLAVFPSPGPGVLAKDFPRLPYPESVFEMRCRADDESREEFSLIVCAVEMSSLHEGQDELLIVPFSQSANGDWGSPGIYTADRITGKFAFRLFKEQGDLDEATVNRCLEDAASYTWCLVRVLAVLNCVNVRTETVEAPKFLNRKRESKGKGPIYSYKTLVLRPNASKRGKSGGTHESPRLHLRRGHIKHRKTGDFWWQPCVVGNPELGRVDKDYRADQLVAA